AWMVFAIGVDAAFELACLIGMAGLAIDRRDLVGMRIAFDVGVAVGALQAAVDAVAELLLVDSDAMARAVGHAGVAVAGEAILRAKDASGNRENGQCGNRGSTGHEPRLSPCGKGHSAAFL